MIRLICVIQTALVGISIILVLVDFISLLNASQILINVSEIIYVLFMSYFIYINIRMIVFNEISPSRLQLCFWVNLVQIFQVSLIGVKYSIVSGFGIMPYLTWADRIGIGIKFDFLQPELITRYVSSDTPIRFGFNVISLALAIFFAKQYDKMKSPTLRGELNPQSQSRKSKIKQLLR